MDKKKYLTKNVALFALNSFGTKIIIFLLVPIYTNVLSKEEYGVLDLVTTLATIIGPAIMLNINEAVQRFCLDDEADHNSIMSVAISALFFSSIVGVVIIPISSLFQAIKPYALLFYLYCVTQSILVVFSAYLRGKEKLNHFAICNIIVTLLGALLNILFLVVFRTGIEGYFLAFIISYIIGSFYAILTGRIYEVIQHFKIDKCLARDMLVYSIVLVPNTLMWWIMNASDRLMVTSMIGLAANGIYAISYKIPSAVSTMSTVFNQAWSFSAIKENKSEDRVAFNKKMYDNLFAVQILLTGFLVAIIRPFMKFYVSEAYFGAWRFTVPLLMGYFFMSMGTFFSVQYTVNKDSKGFLFSGIVGAIVNVGLNFILIPVIETMGAAIATMFSYISVFFYRACDTQKYLEIRVMDGEKAISIMLLAVMAFGAYSKSSVLCISISLLAFFSIVVVMRDNVFELIKIIISACFKSS